MKTFIVSGAGSGIGRAIAQSLAAASPDNSVVLIGRRIESLEETRKGLANAHSHVTLTADVTDPKALRSAFSEIKLIDRNVTGVIANAGIGGPNAYGEDDRWNEIIATNLTGPYNLVNEALPALMASKSDYKHVLLISSILARMGVPYYSAYCASKAGLLGMMRSWAVEWAREKILVNAVCPGWVETEMQREGMLQRCRETGKTYEEMLKLEMAYVPLRKMSKPEELGALVEFLVSGRQTSITGQELDINNGALMV